MVQTTIIITIFFWFIQEIFFVLKYLYWIQDKEYRWDRFYDFLFSDESPHELGLIELLLKIFVLIFIPQLSIFIFIYLTIKYLLEIIKKKFRRPVITNRIKNIGIIYAIFSMCSLVIVFIAFDIRYLLVSEITVLFSIILGVYITSLMSKKIYLKEKSMAENILKEINPFIIGITGSYGKTTTKDFIFQILSNKYKTIRNEGSKNTGFGIVRTINTKLVKEIQYFVCEIGAYKRGEIKNICEWLFPKMAIITAIEPQHIKLFGNIDNIVKAKYELLESLKRGSVAVLNLNNKYLLGLVKDCERLGIKLYGIKKYSMNQTIQPNILYYETIKSEKQSIIFKIYFNNQKRIFQTNIDNEYFLSNLSIAILVSRLLKVDWKIIKRKLLDIELPQKTMNLIKLKSGSIVIDDSYNSTASGTVCALKYMQRFKNYKKTVFMTGIIELGHYSNEIHKNIGRELSKTTDKVILRKKGFEKALREGMGNERHKLILLTDPIKLTKKFIKLADEHKNVILLEGRLPSAIFSELDKINNKK